MRVLAPRDVLNLPATLLVGQTFTWERRGRGFSGHIRWRGRTLSLFLAREGDEVLVEGDAPPDWFPTYFNMQLDIEKIYESFPPLPELRAAVDKYRGMRLLGQDPWEVIVSFIISQNNNIKRIRKIIKQMVMRFGRFPEPEDLTDVSLLSELGLGYRARYLAEVARKLLSGEVRFADLDKESLLSLPGIGPKVASCIMLYGYGRHDEFPVDTWIGRVRRDVDYGPYAGWAQLYLYAWARKFEPEIE